jgi:hypothetical protein
VAPMTERFVHDIGRFACRHNLDVVPFRKGEQ